MPVVQGLSKDQRKAQLADQMGDDGAEPIDLPVAVAPPPAAVAPPAAPDMAALIKMLADALAASGTQTADAIITAQAKRTRHEDSYTSGVGWHGKSVFSHPDGDATTERTRFRCPMYMGVVESDDEGNEKTIPAFEIFADVCTEAERVAYNALKPGSYLVERNDNAKAQWKVIEKKDALGETTRLVVGVPLAWLKKDSQAQMPSQKSFLEQLTGQRL